jgi:hypothetical protein
VRERESEFLHLTRELSQAEHVGEADVATMNQERREQIFPLGGKTVVPFGGARWSRAGAHPMAHPRERGLNRGPIAHP